ncbi:hypothetical protein BaRGS_00014828 [Batillaria attramentaria]|uniref:Uncharacterized protein n=1 Tax=Batillaria attramentaria TaxID=370345 RepID=A0ABD0L340_9CAEN
MSDGPVVKMEISCISRRLKVASVEWPDKGAAQPLWSGRIGPEGGKKRLGCLWKRLPRRIGLPVAFLRSGLGVAPVTGPLTDPLLPSRGFAGACSGWLLAANRGSVQVLQRIRPSTLLSTLVFLLSYFVCIVHAWSPGLLRLCVMKTLLQIRGEDSPPPSPDHPVHLAKRHPNRMVPLTAVLSSNGLTIDRNISGTAVHGADPYWGPGKNPHCPPPLPLHPSVYPLSSTTLLSRKHPTFEM